jgi:hypothetical protein
MPESRYILAAERYRHYAALCREYAEKSPQEFSAQFSKAAQRWERDADRIERDGRALEESRALLGRAQPAGVMIARSG